MNNKGKLIRLLIAIIIPLLAAVFIANYSYNWEVYRNKFKEEYLQKESTSKDSINNFIEFDSYLYEEKPYLIHQYKNEEGKVLFEFKIIRTISLQDDEPTFVNYKFLFIMLITKAWFILLMMRLKKILLVILTLKYL